MAGEENGAATYRPQITELSNISHRLCRMGIDVNGIVARIKIRQRESGTLEHPRTLNEYEEVRRLMSRTGIVAAPMSRCKGGPT